MLQVINAPPISATVYTVVLLDHTTASEGSSQRVVVVPASANRPPSNSLTPSAVILRDSLLAVSFIHGLSSLNVCNNVLVVRCSQYEMKYSNSNSLNCVGGEHKPASSRFLLP